MTANGDGTRPVVGIIGTGSMGGTVARRVLGGGYRLHVHDARPEAVRGLASAGAAISPDPETLAATCDVVLLSLPSHLEVEDVCFSGRGALRSLRPGTGLVNLTTGSVMQLSRLTAAGNDCGIHYVTAPVSQGVDNAARGALSAFAAGTDEGLALALPVLETFCAQVIRLASHEAAMAAKIVTNLSWFINAAALGELMILMVQAGIAREDVQRVLTASCGDSWVARHDIPSALGDYDPTFTLALADKDLRLAAELAGTLGVPLEVGAAARAVFTRALAVFGPGAPELSPVRLMEQLTGTHLGLNPPDPLPSSRPSA
jgi:3-hydroxyisobutyrate dehydrogenase-like beta-hydroxyacid dehydrogenase